MFFIYIHIYIYKFFIKAAAAAAALMEEIRWESENVEKFFQTGSSSLFFFQIGRIVAEMCLCRKILRNFEEFWEDCGRNVFM